jgi:hypothetical protein
MTNRWASAVQPRRAVESRDFEPSNPSQTGVPGDGRIVVFGRRPIRCQADQALGGLTQRFRW